MANLHTAVLQRNKDRIMEILREYPEKVNERDPSDVENSPLLSACEYGMIEIAPLLIEKGADVNCLGRGGNTPLLFCCWNGRLELVTLLLEKGAEINFQNMAGNTPLMTATTAGHIHVVLFLLEKGVDPSVRNNDGMTALDLAIQRGNAGCIELLSKPPPCSLLFKVLANIRHEMKIVHLEVRDMTGTSNAAIQYEFGKVREENQRTTAILAESFGQYRKDLDMNQAYLLNDLSTIKDNISSMMVVIQDLKTEVESLKQELNASKSSNDTKDHEIKFLQKRVKDQVDQINRLLGEQKYSRP